jgi:hypothetical protein
VLFTVHHFFAFSKFFLIFESLFKQTMRKTCENSKIIDKNCPKYLAVPDIFLKTHTHTFAQACPLRCNARGI